jgi:hypothetical protein
VAPDAPSINVEEQKAHRIFQEWAFIFPARSALQLAAANIEQRGTGAWRASRTLLDGRLFIPNRYPSDAGNWSRPIQK